MGVKNTLLDVHNILMEALERLNDDELMDDSAKAKKEVERAKAMTDVGKTIVDNANVILKAQMHQDNMIAEYGTVETSTGSIFLENKGAKNEKPNK